MSIPLTPAVKPFASLRHNEGVPLAEMNPMVGLSDSVPMGNLNVDTGTDLSSSVILANAIVNRHYDDAIQIDIKGEFGVGFVEDNAYRFFIEDWTALTAVSAGTTLDTVNETGLSISGNFGTILIGKEESNRLLIQSDNLRSGLTAAGHGNTRLDTVSLRYQGGMLNRRLELFEDSHAIPVIFERRSATKPAEPTGAGVSFGHPYPGIDGWSLPGLSPSGTDPLWIAKSTFRFNHTYQEWRLDSWIIIRVDSTSSSFTVQYSEDGMTWGSTVPVGDSLWVRTRLPDGTWATHQVRSPERTWAPIGSISFPGDGSSSPITHLLGLPFSPNDFWFVVFEWEWNRNNERTFTPMYPAFAVTGLPWANRSRITYNKSFRIAFSRRQDSGMSRSNIGFEGVGQDRQFVSINFHTADGVDASQAGMPPLTHLTVSAYNPTNQAGVMRIWGL